MSTLYDKVELRLARGRPNAVASVPTCCREGKVDRSVVLNPAALDHLKELASHFRVIRRRHLDVAGERHHHVAAYVLVDLLLSRLSFVLLVLAAVFGDRQLFTTTVIQGVDIDVVLMRDGS